jgi:hypothetical protein
VPPSPFPNPGDWQDLQAEVERLRIQNNALNARLDRLERGQALKRAPARLAELSTEPEDWEEDTQARVVRRKRTRRKESVLTVAGVSAALVATFEVVKNVYLALHH